MINVCMFLIYKQLWSLWQSVKFIKQLRNN